MKLYTALGRVKINKEERGSYPAVTVGGEEKALSIEEMLMWSSLIWQIMTYDELKACYEEKSKEAGVSSDSFEATLQRMVQRRLIVYDSDIRDNVALNKLMSKVYIEPLESSLIAKIIAFVRLIFIRHVPISRAKKVFEKEVHTDTEKVIISIIRKYRLTGAEVLSRLSSDDVYTDETVLNSVAQLYLDRCVLLDA